MYRMPVEEAVTNLDSRTVSFVANQATAIRIDDSSIGVRKTWSSDKISKSKADSESAIIEAYTKAYGPLYLSGFDPNHFDDWSPVIEDALHETDEGKPFLIPWNQYMTAQVIKVDPDAKEKIVFFYRGQTWAMTEDGIYIVDISSGDAKITMKTTAEWFVDRNYVPARAELCIYSDKKIIDGVPYPDIKIGDGNSHVIDLPFFGEAKYDEIIERIDAHIADTNAHVSTADRQFWNNKLNYTQEGELLSFNRN